MFCPFCLPSRRGHKKRKLHYHGQGWQGRSLYYGHRTAHCNPRDLPAELRDECLGYFLVEAPIVRAFDDFDRIADRVSGWEPMMHRDRLRFEFDTLMTARAPSLDRDARASLFEAWLSHREDERDRRGKALSDELGRLVEAKARCEDVAGRLNEIGVEMAQLITPPEYTDPRGEWECAAAD